jgi:hypothetical protein
MPGSGDAVRTRCRVPPSARAMSALKNLSPGRWAAIDDLELGGDMTGAASFDEVETRSRRAGPITACA